MKDYQIYRIDPKKIDIQNLVELSKLSRDKFNHLYRGFEHSTRFYYLYNFFSIASCDTNVYNLYLEMIKCFRHYFDLYEIPKTNVWMQMWMNIHKQEEVLTSHSHAYSLHGYLSLTDHKTDTVFTDDHDGNELYRIKNQSLQLYIGPGYRHHHISVLENYTDERITFGFDIQLTDTISENFSFIPVVL